MRTFVRILCVLTLTLHPSLLGAAEESLKNRIKIKKRSFLARHSDNTTEDYSLDKIELLSRKRYALIQDIRRFIRESKAGDQKSELNLRLATLYMEDYQQSLVKAQQIYDREFDEYNKSKRKGRKVPKLDNSEATASLEKARAIYRDLLERYPKHPRKDEMLFFLGQTSIDRGKVSMGMSYFHRLSTEVPRSKYVNDALVQLGDYYFEKNDWNKAKEYYEQITQKKYRPLVPYAVYKMAWCNYNTKRPSVALQEFKWVIQNEETQEGVARAIRIRNEALRDIALVFVDLRITLPAIHFYKGHGDPYYRKGVETMAQLYYEAGDYKDAIILYDHLIQIDPNYAKNPGYEISIVESMKLGNNTEAAIQRLFSKIPTYLENSNWYEINAPNAQTVEESKRSFEETARKYALQFHADGQRTKNDHLYEVAKQLYAKYLEFFPRSPHAHEIKFYLADIYFKQGQFILASEHYYGVYQDPAAGALKAESIRYALSSLDRQLNEDRKKQGLGAITAKATSKVKVTEEDENKQLPLTDAETRFIEIADVYLSAYPNTKDAPDVLYELAYLQYVHLDFSRAYKSFWNLVQKYPAHDTAMASANLILDILNRRKDFPRLITACKKFLNTPSFKKSEFRAEVADVLRHAELKRIQQIEAAGDYHKAADEYVDYTRTYGTQDEALFEKALYNASVDYTKAGLYLTAVEIQERFLRRFNKSNLREQMLVQVGKTHEMLANFEKAAFYFEQFATQYPGRSQAKNALRFAGLYYWGSGNSRKAEPLLRTALVDNPKEAKLIEADITELYETGGDNERLVHFYMNARAQRGVSFADYLDYTIKIAELYKRLNGKMPVKLIEEAGRLVQKHGKDIAATPKGIEAMSKVYFWYTRQREEYFYALKLSLPQRQLEANLAKKLALLRELEKEYTHLTSLGSAEWGLSAFFKIASAYRHMAMSVAQAPVPADLSAEQVDQYRAEIKKQMVKPFNEKALLMVTQCLDKAQEFDVMSGWTPRCYQLAAELEPARYPSVRTFYLPPLQVAVIVPTGSTPELRVGNVPQYAYPFYSMGMFQAVERGPASISAADLPAIYDSSSNSGDALTVVPSGMNYASLADERRTILKKNLASERPSELKKGGSFAFLNALRTLDPNRAVLSILEAIQKDPTNQALHNLLALAYLDAGNTPAAKVTWLSLIARGAKSSAIWNNLGVVAMKEGKEVKAMGFFNEAIQMDDPREALLNLGFLALKYRNGFQAKKHFGRILTGEQSDVTAQIGFAVAKLQNRELDAAKEALLDLTKSYKRDPYVRISMGYYLMDVEKESELAKRFLSDYIDSQSLEGDLQFRQALQEAKSLSNGGADSISGITP